MCVKFSTATTTFCVFHQIVHSVVNYMKNGQNFKFSRFFEFQFYEFLTISIEFGPFFPKVSHCAGEEKNCQSSLFYERFIAIDREIYYSR